MILRLIILRKSKKTVLVGGNVYRNPRIYGVSVLVLPGGLILDYLSLLLSARATRTKRTITYIREQADHVD
jgi:hypothetical protein